MKRAELPALFQAADTASQHAQKQYLRLFTSTLLLLITGALLGSISGTSAEWTHRARVLSAVLLGVSFIASATLKILSPEKIWFGARAVAESIKSISWRYTVGGEPFGVDLEQREADTKFTKEMRSIVTERRKLAWKYAVEPSDGPEITVEMRTYRARSLGERLTLYIDARVKDQRSWYSTKAGESQRLHMKWFVISTIGQGGALMSAILMTQTTDNPINLTGVFAAVSAAAMAWLQMERYQDLAQSYALAAHELGLIQVEAEYCHTERDFSAFVANAENAISREHTMWIARRDVE